MSEVKSPEIVHSAPVYRPASASSHLAERPGPPEDGGDGAYTTHVSKCRVEIALTGIEGRSEQTAADR